MLSPFDKISDLSNEEGKEGRMENMRTYSKADMAAILMGLNKVTERLSLALAEEVQSDKRKGEAKHGKRVSGDHL